MMALRHREYCPPAPAACLWAGTADELTECDLILTKPSFACLLITDGVVDRLELLIERLLLAGCRYVVCWGSSCSQLHDLVDLVSVMMQRDGRLGTEELVMTTWHDGESLADVVWYARHCAMSDEGIESITLHCVLVDADDLVPQLDRLLQEPA